MMYAENKTTLCKGKLNQTFSCMISDYFRYKMCTNDHGRSSCKGDSGGPLFLTENKRDTIVALVSYGRECNGTSVNAKITENVKTWILKNTIGALDSNCNSQPKVQSSFFSLHQMMNDFFDIAFANAFHEFMI